MLRVVNKPIMLSVSNKPFMLIIVMLGVLAPIIYLFCYSSTAEVDVEKKINFGIFFCRENVRHTFRIVPELKNTKKRLIISVEITLWISSFLDALNMHR